MTHPYKIQAAASRQSKVKGYADGGSIADKFRNKVQDAPRFHSEAEWYPKKSVMDEFDSRNADSAMVRETDQEDPEMGRDADDQMLRNKGIDYTWTYEEDVKRGGRIKRKK